MLRKRACCCHGKDARVFCAKVSMNAVQQTGLCWIHQVSCGSAIDYPNGPAFIVPTHAAER